jgi:hypothetical protein
MPVTIKPSPEKIGRNTDAAYTSQSAFYAALSDAWEKDVIGLKKTSESSNAGKPILHSSFRGLDVSGASPVVPYRNGFVDGVIRAFQQDLNLVIRPDDVWLSILTQFSFYVNKNAETLRKQFVDHEGKIKLELKNMGTSFMQLDVADMAQKFAGLIKEKIVDPEVCDWLLPTFTTTTDNDMAISSMVLMASMKEYFKYVMVCGCGFPSVTLLGEASDWQMILERLDKFAQYGEEPTAWSNLLRPVIKRFIATFSTPESEELKQFWMQAIHSTGKMGSGMEFSPYNGWLTAFMYWDNHGVHLRSSLKTDENGLPPLQLDDQVFPLLPWMRDGVPSGVVEVPVIVEALDLGVKIDTTIVAGSMGVTVVDESTIQPHAGWWQLEDSREPL